MRYLWIIVIMFDFCLYNFHVEKMCLLKFSLSCLLILNTFKNFCTKICFIVFICYCVFLFLVIFLLYVAWSSVLVQYLLRVVFYIIFQSSWYILRNTLVCSLLFCGGRLFLFQVFSSYSNREVQINPRTNH